MKDIYVNIAIILLILKESSTTFIIVLTDDTVNARESNELNFSAILKENRKYDTYTNYCPLRFIGGTDANITQVPYQVALRRKQGFKTWVAFCGGSLITLRFVMTTVHCLFKPHTDIKLRKIRVAAGSTKMKATILSSSKEHWRKIKRFYKHEFYDYETKENNMGIVELHNSFIRSNEVSPVRMHTLDLNLNIRVNEQCLASGFGSTNEIDLVQNTLQIVCVNIISLSTCREFYKREIYDSNLCAGGFGIGSCEGDEGGPIVCRGVLVGIVSYDRNCGRRPGIYTSVLSYTKDLNGSFLTTRSCKQMFSLKLYALILLRLFIK